MSQPSQAEPMKRTEFPDRPWQHLACDLLGPLPSGDSLLVTVDYFSRYIEADIMRSTISEKVIGCLEIIFAAHGLPVSLKTDNGPQLVSEEFESFLKVNDIEHRTSTPLWPQANGEVERQNTTLLKAIRIAQAEGRDWKKELLKFLLAYRSTPHTTTGVTLAKLLFGREIRTKIPDIQSQGTSPMYHEVKDRDHERKQRRKDYADTKRAATES